MNTALSSSKVCTKASQATVPQKLKPKPSCASPTQASSSSPYHLTACQLVDSLLRLTWQSSHRHRALSRQCRSLFQGTDVVDRGVRNSRSNRLFWPEMRKTLLGHAPRAFTENLSDALKKSVVPKEPPSGHFTGRVATERLACADVLLDAKSPSRLDPTPDLDLAPGHAHWLLGYANWMQSGIVPRTTCERRSSQTAAQGIPVRTKDLALYFLCQTEYRRCTADPDFAASWQPKALSGRQKFVDGARHFWKSAIFDNVVDVFWSVFFQIVRIARLESAPAPVGDHSGHES